MKRKLIQQGAGTLMVSLPIDWIRSQHLEKGSEVQLTNTDGHLVVSAKGEAAQRSIAITLPDTTESLVRTLITKTYRNGYDVIDVNFTTEEQFKTLQEVISSRLIGFEVVHRSKKSCRVENVTEPSPDHFDPMLRKIFQNITQLFDAIKELLAGKEPLESVNDIEARIQRFDNFCRRVLSKYPGTVTKKELWWSFLTLVVHAQREMYLLTRSPIQKCSPKVMDYFTQVQAMSALVEKGFYTKKQEHLALLHQQEKKLVHVDGIKLLQTVDAHERATVHYLMTAARQFYLSSSPLLGLID